MTSDAVLAEVLKNTAELMKNEQGEDMMGPVREEEDLELMSASRRQNFDEDQPAATSSTSTTDPALDEASWGDEDDLLLDLMDDIDDAAMYAAMERAVEKEKEKQRSVFGGLKKGFLGKETKEPPTPKPVLKSAAQRPSSVPVIGDVKERTGSADSDRVTATASTTEKKPLSKFKLSLGRP